MQNIDPKGSFLKNLVLSLVLLGVSSLLIPTVLKQIDDRKAVDQQQFQDELARQDKIIDAQAALLDTMAADFWDYESYASDVVISRDERFGQDDWHQRAVDAYYLQSGPLLGTMRAEISTLLQLAPQSNYESFLRLYEEEILPLDSCLLELMKIEAATSGTPQPSGTPRRRDPAAVPLRGERGEVRRGILGHAGGPLLCIRTWPEASIGSLRAWPRRSVSRIASPMRRNAHTGIVIVVRRRSGPWSAQSLAASTCLRPRSDETGSRNYQSDDCGC